MSSCFSNHVCFPENNFSLPLDIATTSSVLGRQQWLPNIRLVVNKGLSSINFTFARNTISTSESVCCVSCLEQDAMEIGWNSFVRNGRVSLLFDTVLMTFPGCYLITRHWEFRSYMKSGAEMPKCQRCSINE